MARNDATSPADRGPSWIDASVAAACLLLVAGVAIPRGLEERLAAEEASAVATLRTLASCQAQVQAAAWIDTDGDGMGEHATLGELAGSVGVRKGLRAGKGRPSDAGYAPLASTFEKVGRAVKPPILPASLREVEGDGFVRKGGYVFIVFLPDAAAPAGWVHESRQGGQPGLSGGTGAVGVDLSETTWCAYGQPSRRGETGTKRFFVNQAWEVLQSPNETARAQGADASFRPGAAFRGVGITSEIAVGTRGGDGDLWTYAR